MNYDGVEWSQQPSPAGIANSVIYAVSALSPGLAWASGYSSSNGSLFLEWQGAGWHYPVPPGGYTMYGVSIADASTAWAVGDVGTIQRWTGQAWAAQPSPATNTLFAVSACLQHSTKLAFAVGMYGTILKWDGSTWSTQNSGTTQNLFGVTAPSEHAAWAVGAGGTILKWDGNTWSAQNSGTKETLYSVSASDPCTAFAVGDKRTILRWDCGQWVAQPVPSVPTLYTYQLNGVAMTPSGQWWAVGSNGDGSPWYPCRQGYPGVILRYVFEARSWVLDSTPPMPLCAVSGVRTAR